MGMGKKKIKVSAMKVAAVRAATGLNQSEFWGRVGVTQSGGSRYEGGRRMPTPVKMLIALAYTANNKERGRIIRRLRGRDSC